MRDLIKRWEIWNAGVNIVSLDQEKGILTVVGTMDPVCVAEQLKKVKQNPVVISVGPPKKPDPKPDPKKDPCFPYYYYTPRDMISVNTYESGSGCTIVWILSLFSLSPCKILQSLVDNFFFFCDPVISYYVMNLC